MTLSLKNELNPKIKISVFCIAVLFFIIRAIQMIVTVSFNLAEPAATLYALDYNFYIGSRTFIGSILTILTSHITYQQIFIMNLCAYIFATLLFLGMAIYLMKKSIKLGNDIPFYLSILAIVAPYSLLNFSQWIGTYDIYLFIFAALCIIATNSKYAQWICPLLCTIAVFTHYAFVFSFFPAVLSVQIFYIFKEKDKSNKIKRILNASLTFITSFISGIYCGFFANSTIKMTRDELYAYMQERLGIPPINKNYIDSYYFNDDVYGMLGDFSESVMTDTFKRNFLLYFLPVFLLIMFTWVNYITKRGAKQIFTTATVLGTAAVSIALIFLIVESPRWQTAATLSQILLIFAATRSNNEDFNQAIIKTDKPIIKITFIIVIPLSIAANFLIKPYLLEGVAY